MEQKIRVGLTLGDSSGVGCEIILKVIGDENITDIFTPVVIGSKAVFDDGFSRYLGLTSSYHLVANDDIEDGKINFIDTSSDPQAPVTPGKPSPLSGQDAVAALKESVRLLKDNRIDCLVTAPISKENSQSPDFEYPGHTEFLEAETGNGETGLMILFDENLRIALLTTHIPVAKIAENIQKDELISKVRKFDKSLRMDFGIVRPLIAVLSLNPHSGDGGLIGEEEQTVIKPAIDELRKENVLVYGPFAADGFFAHGDYLKFDGILAMYHDQGLAPFKAISGGNGVNFTAGLPFVRTSPDHGTAFGIAGAGSADESSMRKAIYNAIDIFRRRQNYQQSSANPLQSHVAPRQDREEGSQKKHNAEEGETEQKDS